MELGLAGMGGFRVKGCVRLGAGAFFLELLPALVVEDLSGARRRGVCGGQPWERRRNQRRSPANSGCALAKTQHRRLLTNRLARRLPPMLLLPCNPPQGAERSQSRFVGERCRGFRDCMRRGDSRTPCRAVRGQARLPARWACFLLR